MFLDHENTPCITCKHVVEQGLSILHVTHNADDQKWHFMCGESKHVADDTKVISMIEAVSIDQTIDRLYDMPPGFGAKRESRDVHWERFDLK